MHSNPPRHTTHGRKLVRPARRPGPAADGARGPSGRGPRGRLRTALLLGAVLLLLAPAAFAADGPALHGQVRDEEGRPLAGARVELRPTVPPREQALADLEGGFLPAPLDSDRTGEEGRYRLTVPQPGFWTVVASAPGRVSQVLPVGPVEMEEFLPPVLLSEDRGLEVRVEDGAGKPVPGAHVVLTGHARFRPGVAASQRTDRRHALTDEAGRARLPRIAHETLRLTVHAAGLPPHEELLEPVGDEASVHRVRLPSTRPRSVVVTEEAKSAGAKTGAATTGAAPVGVEGAVVLVGANRVAVGITGDDGRYDLAAPPADGDEVTVTVLAADGRLGKGTLTPIPASDGDAGQAAPPEPLADVPVPLVPRVVVTGQVVDPEREPVAGAWVWLGGETSGAVRSDPRGGFSVELARGDRDRVALVADRVGFSSTSLVLREDQASGAQPVTVLLQPTAGLRGRVVDPEGLPVAEARVEATGVARGRDYGRGVHRTVSGADGSFALPELEPETAFRLTARHAGYSEGVLETTTPAVGSVREGLEVVLRPGITAFGTVLDLDEDPVPGATVTLAPVPPGGDVRAWFQARTGDDDSTERTGTDGGYEMEDLAPGRYDLRVEARGFAPLLVPGVDLPEGEARVDLGTVLLEPGAVVEGRVEDSDGTAVAEARVTARTESFGLRRSFRADPPQEGVSSGPDGRFRVEDLATGQRVELLVKKEGYAEARVPGVEVPPESPVVVTLEPASSLAGVVVDEVGGPVEDARLVIRLQSGGLVGSPARAIASATTDEDGRFVAEDVPAGELTVTVTARGFQALEKTGLRVEPGAKQEGLRFVLQPGARITGRVRDPAGQPLPDARVLLLEEEDLRHFRGSSSASTDAEGHYELDGIAPGSHSFAAEHPDYLRTVRDLEVRSGDNQLDFRLESGVSLSGRVLDEGGAPVAGARVSANSNGGRNRWLDGEGAVTDEAGEFRLQGLENGVYSLSAVKEGFAEARLDDVRVGPAPVSGVELRLERGAVLTGRLLGVELADLGSATVMVASPGANRIGSLGSVDYEGRYRVEGLTPGEWSIVGTLGEGKASAIEEITIEPGQREAYKDLDLGAGFTLSGQVLMGAEPMVGVFVAVLGQEQARGGFARTDHQGSFRIAGLEGGAYRLEVSSLGGAAGHREELEIAGDREITVRLESASLGGRVLSTTGLPLEGAEVFLDAEESDRIGFGNSVRTRADGSFRFPTVGTGRYRVRAEMEGHAPGAVEVQVQDGLPVEGLEIQLEPSRGLTLRVSQLSGTLPVQVRVAGFDPAAPATPGAPPRPAFTETAAVGEGGRVQLDRVPAGTWRLLVSAQGLAVSEVTAVAPGPPVAVALAPEAILSVRVEPLTGTGQLGEVRVLGSDGRPFVHMDWGGRPRSTFDLAVGRAQVTGLPAGTWTVEATTPAGDRWTGQAVTVPGRETEVVLP